MTSRSAFRRAVTVLAFGIGVSVLPAQDGIEELARSREGFEKEISFATRPIRDRYLSRLESMKRSLGSRGDARAAAAVQDEIDRVNAMSPEPSGVVRFVGTWAIQYANGVSRRYSFAADGNVTYDELGGKPVVPPTKVKLMLKGTDFVIDWGDGSLERFKISGKNLNVEHFNPKATYPAGPPSARGVGTISAGR